MIRRTRGGLWYVVLQEGRAECVCLEANGDLDAASAAQVLNRHIEYVCARLGIAVLIRQEDVEKAYQEMEAGPE